MWQEIAVLIIGLIVIFCIGKKIYKFFGTSHRNGQSLSRMSGMCTKEQNQKQPYLILYPKTRDSRKYHFAILYRQSSTF